MTTLSYASEFGPMTLMFNRFGNGHAYFAARKQYYTMADFGFTDGISPFEVLFKGGIYGVYIGDLLVAPIPPSNA